MGGSLSSPLTVYYAVGGSATYGTDYTLNPSPAGVPRIFSATIPEGAETVDVTLLPVRDSLVE
ncbi:MAG: hypothetical protein O8C63_03065, partial [Candidatus Methanoperedens sp.]|nr:hypothetical protein [Candidatus Methanoperedens sp.]